MLANVSLADALKYGSGTVLVVGGAATLLMPVILPAVGFGPAGPIAGSIATTIQASYGGAVTAGSWFAVAQSAGAAGISTAATASGAGATGGGATILLWDTLFGGSSTGADAGGGEFEFVGDGPISCSCRCSVPETLEGDKNPGARGAIVDESTTAPENKPEDEDAGNEKAEGKAKADGDGEPEEAYAKSVKDMIETARRAAAAAAAGGAERLKKIDVMGAVSDGAATVAAFGKEAGAKGSEIFHTAVEGAGKLKDMDAKDVMEV
ncbi:hypothetical protein BOTBODRAFT_30730 [Botryobasidium botryosum FD-172 SS1]|uniref:Uncharacterized protein n=1 Tax=Botryobasidium botryosum (strain FD-172 SS1) TaxID=930990 RepID=A0A067MM74_BOTB1|nr:hypothetical protein BOTBODRAFT_30730 [Botryobasidium botryosum FD-172 SS1]